MSLTLLTLGLLCARPADAQGGYPGGPKWSDPTTTGTGMMDYTYTYQGHLYDVQGQLWGSDWTRTPPSMVQAGSDTGYSSHVDTSGTITVTRTWTGSGSPPPSVSIKEISNASGGGGQANGPAGSGEASDAFGDPAVPTSDGHSVISQGSLLIQKDSSSGTISASGYVSASGDTPASNGYQGLSIALGTFGWVFDPRAVIIKCFTIEDSTGRGSGASGGTPDVRSPDGSIVTDSAVSPPLDQPGGSTSWTASPTLWAQATAFQSPVYSWSTSGSGSLSAGNSDQAVLSVVFPVSTTDTALNKENTATVRVTDADGAVAPNTFTIRWHYPKENAVLIASGQPFWQPIVSSNVTAIGYIDGNATGDFGIATYNDFVPTAVADIFPVASSITPIPIWAAFVAALGVKAGDIKPDVHSVSTNFDQCWNSPFSTGLPVPLDPALMNQYQMSPLLVVQYQEQTWQYDQYGQKGYLGPAQEGDDHFMGSVQSAGEFSKIGPPPAGGA